MNVKDLLSLEGKVILVSGGAGKYGRCIVEGLAEAGGTVITASRHLEAGQKLAQTYQAQGLDVHALQVDQADHESVMTLKENILREFGGLDVFVNSAVKHVMEGYIGALEDWVESMRVNATGMFDLLREMIDLIAQRGGGAVVNIASMFGVFGPDFSNYQGTDIDSAPDYHFHKGGMIALSRYLARKLAPQNIRVNCISPGGLFANQSEPFLSRYVSKVPLGRMAQPDDIKGLVVFLASPACSYVTGENILMDGGLHT